MRKRDGKKLIAIAVFTALPTYASAATFSYDFDNGQATGSASTLAHSTGWVNCQSRSRRMSPELAPMALRMPISLVRRSAV